MITPKSLAAEAQNLMTENKIRHLPVVGDGKRLLGLVTRQRLALKSDVLGSLNVWEITRRLANLTVKDVMLAVKAVHTIDPDKTVERAAKLLAEHRIGCLPVIEEGMVAGIITETDLLQSYQEMLGLPTEWVRITVRMPNQPGEFAKLAQVLVDNQWGVMGIGTFPSPRREGYYDAVLKIPNLTAEEAKAAFRQIASQEIIDLREVV
jgi:acetoin utilization protein AcuB